MDDWSLCSFFNMDYNSEYSLLERVKKARGANFKSSVEARVARTFYQRHPVFLMGHSTQDVAVSTLLPGFSTLDKRSRAGKFGTRHELER